MSIYTTLQNVSVIIAEHDFDASGIKTFDNSTCLYHAASPYDLNKYMFRILAPWLLDAKHLYDK